MVSVSAAMLFPLNMPNRVTMKSMLREFGLSVINEPKQKLNLPKRHASKLSKMRKKRLAEEQAMHDRVLLDTFASEDEIIMARDGKITSIKTEIRLTNRSMNKADGRLNQLRKQAANLERAGKPVTEKLSNDIKKAQAQITEYETFVNTKQVEKDKIHQQFETDVTRYRKLRPSRRVQ